LQGTQRLPRVFKTSCLLKLFEEQVFLVNRHFPHHMSL
jgi:hypothetical protein